MSYNQHSMHQMLNKASGPIKALLNSRIFAGAVLIALFLAFGARAWYATRSDVWAYFDAGKRVLEGVTPYKIDPTPFKYSPIVAYLFIPFSFLSLKAAELSFFLISFVLALIPYLKTRKILGTVAMYTLLLVMVRFHNYDFMNLQITHWILGLLFVAWNTRKTHPWLATFSWAFAAHFKLSPLMLMIIPALYLDWRTLLRMSTAFVVLGVLPGFLHPHGFSLYPEWFSLMKETTPWPASLDPILQSVPTFLWIKLHDVIEPKSFQVLYLSLLGLFCAYTALKTYLNREGEHTEEAGYSALLVATALFSPLAWKHAYVLCFPAYFLLLKTRRYLPFWIAFFMMTVIPSVLRAIDPPLSDLSFFTVWGAVFLAVKVLDTRPHPYPQISGSPT